MNVKIFILMLLLAIIAIVGGFLYFGETLARDEVPRMSVEDLKALLDDPETDDLIILDVRTGSSWSESEQMIQTAIREDPEDFESWSGKYPKDTTIVLYCS